MHDNFDAIHPAVYTELRNAMYINNNNNNKGKR